MALVLGLLVIASSVIPRRTLAVLVYAAVVVAVAGVLRSADSAESLLAGWGGGRYFMFGTATIIAIVIAALTVGKGPPKVAGIVLGVLLIVGVVWDFQIPAPPDARAGRSGARASVAPTHAWSRSSPAATGTCAGRVASRATSTRRRGPADDAPPRPAALSAPCSRTVGATGSTRAAAGRR